MSRRRPKALVLLAVGATEEYWAEACQKEGGRKGNTLSSFGNEGR